MNDVLCHFMIFIKPAGCWFEHPGCNHEGLLIYLTPQPKNCCSLADTVTQTIIKKQHPLRGTLTHRLYCMNQLIHIVHRTIV